MYILWQHASKSPTHVASPILYYMDNIYVCMSFKVLLIKSYRWAPFIKQNLRFQLNWAVWELKDFFFFNLQISSFPNVHTVNFSNRIEIAHWGTYIQWFWCNYRVFNMYCNFFFDCFGLKQQICNVNLQW